MRQNTLLSIAHMQPMNIFDQQQQQVFYNKNNDRPNSMFLDMQQPNSLQRMNVTSLHQQVISHPKSFVDGMLPSSSITVSNNYNVTTGKSLLPQRSTDVIQQIPICGTSRQAFNDENLPVQFVPLCR